MGAELGCAPGFSDGAALGTDNLGRDVLSRWLAGGWRLLLWSAAATVLGVGLGAVLGMVAAMRGGWLDALIMRIGDIGLALPQLVFAMLAVTVLGPKGWVLILVVGLTHVPQADISVWFLWGSAAALAAELNGILHFMEQLNEVDVDGVEPMTGVEKMRLKRREDVVTDGHQQAAVLANAPDAREGFFVVPKVVE